MRCLGYGSKVFLLIMSKPRRELLQATFQAPKLAKYWFDDCLITTRFNYIKYMSVGKKHWEQLTKIA
jgi:hypothetical protein